MSKLKIDWNKKIIKNINTNEEWKILSISRDWFQIVADFEGNQKIVNLIFNKEWFKKDWTHINWTRFSDKWYDFNGYDPSWFDKERYGKNWYNRDWFDRTGYDADWFDRTGYNKDGYDKGGYSKNGYNKAWFGREWFNERWIHWITGTSFNPAGFNIHKESLINPQSLVGNWNLWWALDFHTAFSSHDSFGNFKNIYTQLWDYIHSIKYKQDYSVLEDLVNIIVEFISGKYLSFKELKKPFLNIDWIIPVPPSILNRTKQPVYEIATKLWELTGIPVYFNCLEKIKVTQTIKNLTPEQAMLCLNNAFTIKNAEILTEKNILLIDDIFGEWTTLNEIAKTIKNQSRIRNLFVLTVTKIRTTGLQKDNQIELNNDKNINTLEIPF